MTDLTNYDQTREAGFGDFVQLLKPRVMSLVVFTAMVGLLVAPVSVHPFVAFTSILFIALGGGASGALNMWYDADIDAVMRRTRSRPIPAGRVTEGEALGFGLALSIISCTMLGLAANWFAGAFLGFTIFFYVVIYTMILKRRTEQNIVWGGIAGCFPVLIGWSAVTGSLTWTPFILFLLVFLWTPPHYWPLSMKYKGDYQEADVPMLGATRDGVQVGLQVILYAWATVACSLLLIPVAGMGLVYTVSAVVFGGWFVYESHVLYNRAVRGEQIKPMRVFHASITYLTLLFLAIAVDPLLPF